MHEDFFFCHIVLMDCLLNYGITFQCLKCIPQKTFQACHEKARTKVWLLLRNVLSDTVTFLMYIVCLLSSPPSLSLSPFKYGLSFSLTFCQSWSGLSLLSSLWCQRGGSFVSYDIYSQGCPNYMFFGRFSMNDMKNAFAHCLHHTFFVFSDVYISFNLLPLSLIYINNVISNRPH